MHWAHKGAMKQKLLWTIVRQACSGQPHLSSCETQASSALCSCNVLTDATSCGPTDNTQAAVFLITKYQLRWLFPSLPITQQMHLLIPPLLTEMGLIRTSYRARPLTVEGRVRSRASSCGIFGAQSGTRIVPPPSISVFPCQYHSITARYSSRVTCPT